MDGARSGAKHWAFTDAFHKIIFLLQRVDDIQLRWFVRIKI
jgi:hypothetical protein